MGGGGVEVAPDGAPAGEGGEGVPVAGHGLVAFRGLRAALAEVVRFRCRLRVVRMLRCIRIGCG